jgi:hypothetical protein
MLKHFDKFIVGNVDHVWKLKTFRCSNLQDMEINSA